MVLDDLGTLEHQCKGIKGDEKCRQIKRSSDPEGRRNRRHGGNGRCGQPHCQGGSQYAPGIDLICHKLTDDDPVHPEHRSEEHTSELQSLMRISYAVFCLKKKK